MRDREKPTWRERDARRAKPREERGPARSEPSQPGYRAQLEKLFASGAIGKLVAEREKAQAEGRDADKLKLPGAREPSSAPPAMSGAPVAPTAAAAPTPVPAAPAEEAPAAPKSRKKAPPTEPKRSDLLARVHDAVGRDDITAAVDVYLAKHGWPDDFDFLGQALEHRSDEKVHEVLGHLDRLLGKQRPRRERALAARLRALEETARDPELSAVAGRVRARLG